MSNIIEFTSIPEISFIDEITPEEVLNNLILDYKKYVQEETGEEITISSGSPERLLISAFTAQIYQAYAYIDNAAKMGLLKYSAGDYLDNLGLLRGLTRKEASSSSCTVKFILSDIRQTTTAIPAGTRLSAGSVYFSTSEYLEIQAGTSEGTITAIAEAKGTSSNGLQVNEINTIVDPIPYIASVTNITPSSGGTDVEDDDSFTLRIYSSPAGYSVAGPTDAYIFHAKNSIAYIGDVVAFTPEAGRVTVVFTMKDGSLPAEEKIKELEEALNEDEIRPLTDTVTVKAPAEVSYDINLKYYIAKSDENKATTIQNNVNDSIQAYKQWQRKIGRDITASKLIQLIMSAGAKRVEVTAPSFLAIEKDQIAKIEDESVIYGGLERD